MPPLVILLITYARTEYTLRTIQGICDNLRYDGDIEWYISDDGSNEDHYTAVMTLLTDLNQAICGHHSKKLGYGAGVNKGWRIASQTSPITLWIEDDWQLRSPFNVSPYVNLLINKSDIGMVRLGHLPVGQLGESIGINGRMYLKIQRDRQYAFSGNPHLKHDRFMLHYGDYPEGRDPGDTEIGYDWNFRDRNAGPDIVWPLAIGDNFIFHHIGEHQSYVK